MDKKRRRALLIFLPVVALVPGDALAGPARAEPSFAGATSANLLGGGSAGVLDPVTGILGGVTGADSGEVWGPVTGTLGGATGGGLLVGSASRARR
jgi:hypothetical protein